MSAPAEWLGGGKAFVWVSACTAVSTLFCGRVRAGAGEQGRTVQRRWLGQVGGVCGRACRPSKPILGRSIALFFVIFYFRVDFGWFCTFSRWLGVDNVVNMAGPGPWVLYVLGSMRPTCPSCSTSIFLVCFVLALGA